MLASTSEASASPARPTGRPSAEAAAAAAAGAATDLVVRGFFGVLPDGAVRVGFAFGVGVERGRCTAVPATGSSRAAAVALGLLVDTTEEPDPLVEDCVADEPLDAGSGFGAVVLDPELAVDGNGSGAGAERLAG